MSIKGIANTALVAVLVLIWLGVVGSVVGTPVVRYSNSTGECVAVLPPEAGDCSDIPARHSREWVK